MTDDSWRDNYDSWKLASPDDEYDDDPCDHHDYEIDILDYRCRCDCGHSWHASSEQVLAEIDRQRDYAEYEERENRKQWWRDLWQSIKSVIPRRKKLANINDDDIPF